MWPVAILGLGCVSFLLFYTLLTNLILLYVHFTAFQANSLKYIYIFPNKTFSNSVFHFSLRLKIVTDDGMENFHCIVINLIKMTISAHQIVLIQFRYFCFHWMQGPWGAHKTQTICPLCVRLSVQYILLKCLVRVILPSIWYNICPSILARSMITKLYDLFVIVAVISYKNKEIQF